jgi:hypothetical protein
VDFSQNAIILAQALSEELGVFAATVVDVPFPGEVRANPDADSHQEPPAITAPMAMKLKIATSWQKWMNQAQKKPRVSSMALPSIQPRKVDMRTPMMP